jgi:tetratricopeptide (TPR) repeat protein
MQTLGDFLEFGPDGTVEFRHHIVRDVAYEGLSYRRRRELHLRAGAAIERLVGDDTESVAEPLSFHFYEGRDYQRAWRYARVAGDRAREDYANVEAAAHYRRALDAVRRLAGIDPQEVRSTWVLVGDVLEQAGLLEDALDAYRKASSLTSSDPVERAQILLKRARARERAGRFVAAQRELGAAERLLEEQDGDAAARTRVAIMTFRAIVREGQERPSQALAEARRAADAAAQLGEKAQLAKAYSVMDYAHVRLGEPERASYTPLIIKIYESIGKPDEAASALGNGGAVAFVLGRWSEALDSYRRAEAAYRRTGDVVNAATAQSNIGELLINRGQLEEARVALTDAARTHRAVGHVDGALFDEIQLGRLLRGQGEHDKATKLLETVRSQAASLHLTGFALHASIHLAECLVDQQRSDDALAILAEAERAAGAEAGMFAASVALVRALALTATNALVEAEAATAAGIAEARRSGMLYELGLLLVLHSDICERLGAGTPERDRAEGSALLEQLEVVTDL